MLAGWLPCWERAPPRKHAHAIYRDFFSAAKIKISHWIKFDIFNIVAQNIGCGYIPDSNDMLDPRGHDVDRQHSLRVSDVGKFARGIDMEPS